MISIDLRENRSTFRIINPNLKDKIVRIESLQDCHVFERLYTYPISKQSFLFTRKAYSIFIATLWESLSKCSMDTKISINIIATLWIDLDELHQTWIRFDRISKEVFLTYRLFQMYTIITYRSLQSQLPQIRHSIGDYIYIYVHIFTIMIGKRMHSWDYWDYLMRMLLTIRKLKLDTPTILQIKDPGIRGISLFRLQKLFIISSRIDLFALKSLSTLGIGESFDFKPLCHCLHWSHQHQHQDHYDPW